MKGFPRRTLLELTRRSPDSVPRDAVVVATAAIEAVWSRGERALREYAERFGDVLPGAPLVIERDALARALARLPASDRERLERVAARIRSFAEAQRQALAVVTVPVPGGAAGHWVAPVERAGCYAPGGRYPLPSSVLMTAVTARVAGVREVWVASPNPPPITLAAAAVAGADGLLCAGGAHAIAALAYGAGPIPPCDAIVGPGNRFVTAAKQLVAGGGVAIDTLAGASELLVFADAGADPGVVAAELVAQAEHDPDARPMLVTTDATFADRVDEELDRQLADLPTAGIARAALANGGVIVVQNVDEGIATCDAIAPEHLRLDLRDAAAVATRLAHYGALFIGSGSSVVLGDYGVGPNHVLPTAGTARQAAGLSVYAFLRVRTWLRIDDPVAARPLLDDAAWFARVEGLEAHARAAERLGDHSRGAGREGATVTRASAGSG
ncbi:MAG TPA: histidinol dehydrogenase [Gemmatimonadales bacterium]|jgi:phosphoribosyl-ATP pyrophosphohydrolase/phosphoribosyl-AMP cyclohydrolase/histidinol dehydrogenase|nr:histidinol dehydrogenase [Gemmatimonadales bacterium]